MADLDNSKFNDWMESRDEKKRGGMNTQDLIALAKQSGAWIATDQKSGAIYVVQFPVEAWQAFAAALTRPDSAAPAGVEVVAWINYPCKIDGHGNFAGHGEPELSFKRESYGYYWNKAVPLAAAPKAPAGAQEALEDAAIVCERRDEFGHTHKGVAVALRRLKDVLLDADAPYNAAAAEALADLIACVKESDE